MKQTTKRFISMIVGLVLLVSSLVLYFEFIQPAYEGSQEIKSQQLSRQAFLGGEQATIKRVQELIDAYQGQSEIQDAVSLAFPVIADEAGALAQIYGLARINGLGVQSVSISAAGVQNVPVLSGGQQESFGFSLRRPIGTVDFRVKMTGSYEDLKSFLSMLESNIRIFDVEALAIQQVGARDQATPNFFTYELTVVTHYQSK